MIYRGNVLPFFFCFLASSNAWQTFRPTNLGFDRNSSVQFPRTTTTSRLAKHESMEIGGDHSVVVSYEGRSCELSVKNGETILNAMERQGVTDTLGIPELPSECRRGNCLTCSGKHSKQSQLSSLQRGDDGLSPHVSKQVEQSGYILTCSSYVVGDGLRIELGENHNAWEDLYVTHLMDNTVGRAAMAKSIRLADERNLERWAAETMSALEKSSSQ